jgi:hypothetical protein
LIYIVDVLLGLDEYINSRMFKDEAGVWVCGFCGKTSGPKTNIRNHIGKLAEKQCFGFGSFLVTSTDPDANPAPDPSHFSKKC